MNRPIGYLPWLHIVDYPRAFGNELDLLDSDLPRRRSAVKFESSARIPDDATGND